MKKCILLMLTLLACAVCLCGCGESDDTVEHFIVSGTAYQDKADFKSAEQPKKVSAKCAVYASVDLIESPAGMKYTVRWSLDGKEIKSEERAVKIGPRSVMCFELEAEKAAPGLLKVEVIYSGTVLCTRELTVE